MILVPMDEAGGGLPRIRRVQTDCPPVWKCNFAPLSNLPESPAGEKESRSLPGCARQGTRHRSNCIRVPAQEHGVGYRCLVGCWKLGETRNGCRDRIYRLDPISETSDLFDGGRPGGIGKFLTELVSDTLRHEFRKERVAIQLPLATCQGNREGEYLCSFDTKRMHMGGQCRGSRLRPHTIMVISEQQPNRSYCAFARRCRAIHRERQSPQCGGSPCLLPWLQGLFGSPVRSRVKGRNLTQTLHKGDPPE